MQLDNKPTISPIIGASLAAAACSLLGSTPTQAADLSDKDWIVDSALLYYGEDQGRVQDVSLRAAVTHIRSMKTANSISADGGYAHRRLAFGRGQ